MKRTILPFVLLLLSACGGSQSDEVVTTEDPWGVEQTDTTEPAAEPSQPTLNANTESFDVAGIHVIHKQTPANAIVDVRVFIDGGTAYSNAATAGAEDLAIAVATSGGPASMEKVAFTAAMEGMGASIGGAMDYDYATLSLSAIGPYFDDAWALFADTLRAPAFRETDLELRRELTLTGLRTEMDDPDTAVSVLAKEIAFAGSRYAVRPSGTIETVSALTLDDLRAAWDAMLVKSRLTVVVVGNIDRSEVEALVAEAFGDLPAGDDFIAPSHDESFAFDAATVHVEPRPGQPTNYVLGYFAAPPVSHPDYPALQAALEILSDRLFEEVRTRRNLSYAVASGLSNRRLTTGYLYVTAEQANLTLGVMLDTVDGMIDPQVPQQDLHDQIEGYLTRYYSGLQSNGAQASLLGRWALTGGGRESADLHLARLAEVTADDVARVLQTYVSNIQWVVVGEPEAVDAAVFTAR